LNCRFYLITVRRVYSLFAIMLCCLCYYCHRSRVTNVVPAGTRSPPRTM